MDAEKIAKGLTKAQREAVMHQPDTHQEWSGRHTSLWLWQSWMDVGRPLMQIGVIAFNENPRRSDTHFTALGLAVRDVIARDPRP